MASNNSNGPRLPCEAPSHDPIDVVNRMGDRWSNASRVDEGRGQRLAQELSGLVLRVKQHPHALTKVVDRLARLDRSECAQTASAR